MHGRSQLRNCDAAVTSGLLKDRCLTSRWLSHRRFARTFRAPTATERAVRQDIDASELDQEGRVTDPRHRGRDAVRAQLRAVVGNGGQRLAARRPALERPGEQFRGAAAHRVRVPGIGVPEASAQMMRELGGGTRLSQKPIAHTRLAGEITRKNLDRHLTLESRDCHREMNVDPAPNARPGGQAMNRRTLNRLGSASALAIAVVALVG